MQKIMLTIAATLLVTVHGQGKIDMSVGGGKVQADMSGNKKYASFQRGKATANGQMENENGTMKYKVNVMGNKLKAKTNMKDYATVEGMGANATARMQQGNVVVQLNKPAQITAKTNMKDQASVSGMGANLRAGMQGGNMTVDVNGPVKISAQTNMKSNLRVSGMGNKIEAEMGKENGTESQSIQVKGNGYNVEVENSEFKRTGGNMMETRVKFDKYFSYGMDTANLALGSKTKQCSNSGDCGDNKFQKMCCVSAVMTDKRQGTQEQMFRCMNYKLASVNFEFAIENVSVNMKCIDSQSSATYMGSAFLASMVSLILMTLN